MLVLAERFAYKPCQLFAVSMLHQGSKGEHVGFSRAIRFPGRGQERPKSSPGESQKGPRAILGQN